LAAADTAPTAGNFQGFVVVFVKNKEIKKQLVEAANNQPYVNAPIVLVFCMDPSRVKMNFPPETLSKFSLQDATLAAAYSQLAASALGLSSIWIGMTIVVFFEGFLKGYATLKSSAPKMQIMNSQQMQQMMNDPQFMNQ